MEKREMFKYGPDPYALAYLVIVLIPEFINLGINGIKGSSFNLPYWLLTVVIITMVLSFLTSIVYINHINDNERRIKVNPLLILTSVILLAYLIVAGIRIGMNTNPLMPLLVIAFVALGLVSLSVYRKNWISLVLSLIFLVFSIISLVI